MLYLIFKTSVLQFDQLPMIAERSGLRKDDHIVSANGRDLREASKWQALEAIFSYKHAQSTDTLIVLWHQQPPATCNNAAAGTSSTAPAAVGFLYSY